MRPFCHHIPTADADVARARLGDAAIVPIAMEAETVAVGRAPVQPKSPLSHVPVIGSVLTTREQRGITTEGLAVDPIVAVRAKPATVAGGSLAAQLGAAAARNQESPRVFRVLRDHVDHAIDRVGAPQCCPWSADDLDPVHVRETSQNTPEKSGV